MPRARGPSRCPSTPRPLEQVLDAVPVRTVEIAGLEPLRTTGQDEA